MILANDNIIRYHTIEASNSYEIRLSECSNNEIYANDIRSDNLRDIEDSNGNSNDISGNYIPFRRNVIIFCSIGGVGILAVIFTVIQVRKRLEKAANDQKTEMEAKLDELKKYVDFALDKLDR